MSSKKSSQLKNIYDETKYFDKYTDTIVKIMQTENGEREIMFIQYIRRDYGLIEYIYMFVLISLLLDIL